VEDNRLRAVIPSIMAAEVRSTCSLMQGSCPSDCCCNTHNLGGHDEYRRTITAIQFNRSPATGVNQLSGRHDTLPKLDPHRARHGDPLSRSILVTQYRSPNGQTVNA
jgi:hypothetical protein